ARGGLAARGADGEVGRQPDRGQHLLLLLPQRVRVERHGLFHRGQREQLQQVVLDDVARGADPVVVAGPAANADVLRHRDLHVIHVAAVPDRLVPGGGGAPRPGGLGGLPCPGGGDAGDRGGGGHTVQDGRSTR